MSKRIELGEWVRAGTATYKVIGFTATGSALLTRLNAKLASHIIPKAASPQWSGKDDRWHLQKSDGELTPLTEVSREDLGRLCPYARRLCKLASGCVAGIGDAFGSKPADVHGRADRCGQGGARLPATAYGRR